MSSNFLFIRYFYISEKLGKHIIELKTKINENNGIIFYDIVERKLQFIILLLCGF